MPNSSTDLTLVSIDPQEMTSVHYTDKTRSKFGGVMPKNPL